ncbi:HSP20-like chaperones superfamily protein isoform X2 [Carex rostrata]
MSRHPEVKWAERLDKVYLTIQLPDAKDANVDVQPDGTFTFSGSAGSANNKYELELTLHDKINKEESKINKGMRSIFCVLVKEEPCWWKKLLRGDGKTPHYIKVDWDKWADEDEEGGDVDVGGMDFSNLGGMEGMGGMGGMANMMGGMGGMANMMGGMGGMANMMGGMGAEGMDDDLEGSEDEEEAEKPQLDEAENPKDEGAKTQTAPST